MKSVFWIIGYILIITYNNDSEYNIKLRMLWLYWFIQGGPAVAVVHQNFCFFPHTIVISMSCAVNCTVDCSQINHLQRSQNCLSHTAVNTHEFSHITPVLRSLHWLKNKFNFVAVKQHRYMIYWCWYMFIYWLCIWCCLLVSGELDSSRFSLWSWSNDGQYCHIY